MRAFGIWMLSVIMVVALGWGLAGNWGNVIGLYYVTGSGVGYAIYRLARKKKSRFTSTKIELGKGTGFVVPTEDHITKAPV